MSYCLNPDCQKPKNSDNVTFCQNCGGRLLLKDRYRALQPIGQGGFGRTFLAVDEDKPSKPLCVIKQFFPDVQSKEHWQKAAELFEQEAQRLEELGKHAQIPELLAHFTQDQQQYLIQEFIEGRNLAKLLENGVFTEVQIRGVLNSLLPVLEFIHTSQVIHRDIKPENIIARVSSSPRVLPANQPDWLGVLNALAAESEQGFKDGYIRSHRFSERVSASFAQVPAEMTIAHAHRWQQMASHFANYPRLSFQQRQYLVADAYRLTHEMRRIYETQGASELEAQLVLVDFGAAKRTTGTTALRTGTSIGSPEYIAPEQARGKAVFASDLYSLGVTCLHLLTGISPFDLFDTNEDAWVWRRYLTYPVGDELGQILDRLVEPGTRRRYQSASEVLQQLNPSVSRAPYAAPTPRVLLPQPFPGLASTKIQVKPSFTINRKQQATATKTTTPRKRSSFTALQSNTQWQCARRFSGLGSKVQAIALSSDGQILVGSVGNNVALCDLQSGQVLRKLAGHFDVVQTIALSADNQLLATGGFDKTIRLWNPQTGQRLAILSLHTDTVLAIALNPSGSILASSSVHDPIKLWDIHTGQEQKSLEGHAGRIDALTFSPDGTLLASGSIDTTIKLWDVTNGQELRSLTGHTQLVSSVAFSPDGKTLSSSSWDGTVKLWNLRTRKEKRSLEGHSGRVTTCAFSPDGKLLASAGDEIKLWQLRTGKEVETLVGHTNLVSALAFSSDGNYLVSGSLDGTIALWARQ